MKEEIKRKLSSRKFWLSVAAFLGSVAVSINGMTTNDKWLAIMGMICGVTSAALYSAVEAYTDAAHKKDGE